MPATGLNKTKGRIRWPGLLAGLFTAIFIFSVPTPTGMEDKAWSVVALTALMGIWWATEAIPIPITSLMPIVALPLLDVASTKAAAAPYGAPVIFLLLGGFVAAMGMQRSGLHRRIALAVVARAGDHPAGLIAGFMAAAAGLSMWISNTATTLMLVPIALTVAETVLGKENTGHRFTLALLIGCAWSASIGGLGTYIGTPPNLFVKAFVEETTGYEILFIEWMAFALPVVLTMVPLAWLLLTRVCFRFDPGTITGGGAVVAAEQAKMGAITPAETRVAVIMATMAILWMTRQFIVQSPLVEFIPPLARLTDTHIALLGAIAMFIVPRAPGASGEPLLSWDEAVKLPWGVLLLFGGGLSIAGAIQSTELSLWLGKAMGGLTEAPLYVMMFAVVFLVIFLTELTSNTATTAALVPVMGAIAGAADFNPLLLAAPVAMAASSAFMLPVATGPNAVVFATGQIKVSQMMRAGLYLNLIGSLVVTTLCYMLVPYVFGL